MGVGVSGDGCCNGDDGWGDKTDDKNYCSLGSPCDSAGKESACHVGDLGSVPELGESPGEGKGYPLQYSGIENSMDCIVHGVAKNHTWLSDFHWALINGSGITLNYLYLLLCSISQSYEALQLLPVT